MRYVLYGCGSVVLFFFVAIVLALMGYSRPEPETVISEFLEKADPSEIKDLKYEFMGNHAGYNVMIRLEASESALERLVKLGKIEDLGLDNSKLCATQQEHINFKVKVFGKHVEWFDLDMAAKPVYFRIEGKNRFTKLYIHDFYYFKDKKLLYMIGAGI
ncbi:MAG: hypothetical protein JXR97_04940 [Planctomycetes bacterium]|nr:hypothetical protein [Planctomycetota bacterium]